MIQVLKDCKGYKVFREQQVTQALREHRVSRVILEQPVIQVRRDYKVFKALLVIQVHKEHKVSRVIPELRATLGRKVFRV